MQAVFRANAEERAKKRVEREKRQVERELAREKLEKEREEEFENNRAFWSQSSSIGELDIPEDISVIESAVRVSRNMMFHYLMSLVYDHTQRLRRKIADLIERKIEGMSHVVLNADPFHVFSVMMKDTKDGVEEESMYEVKLHEILYGRMHSTGPKKGIWTIRSLFGYATDLFREIQWTVFEELGLFLMDHSTVNGKIMLTLSNKFGMFQLIRKNRGIRFWHGRASLPSDLWNLVTNKESEPKPKHMDLTDAPEYIEVPIRDYEDYMEQRRDPQDLEDETDFVRAFTRVRGK
jgi:hypothetical protein